MASLSVWIKEVTLNWVAEKPTGVGEGVDSPPFPFADSQPHLRLVFSEKPRSTTGPRYSIFLCSAHDAPLPQTCVATSNLLDGDRIAVSRTALPGTSPLHIFFARHSAITREIPDFQSRGHMHFKIVLRSPSAPVAPLPPPGSSDSESEDEEEPKTGNQSKPSGEDRSSVEKLSQDFSKLLTKSSSHDVQLKCGED